LINLNLDKQQYGKKNGFKKNILG